MNKWMNNTECVVHCIAWHSGIGLKLSNRQHFYSFNPFLSLSLCLSLSLSLSLCLSLTLPLPFPLSLSIASQAVISSAKKAVCEMLCRWALLEGELGSFLDTAMDSEVMTDY
jgi:hypothetical protein